MPRSGLILAIESSCDETAAAVVERGSRTLSSVVASQISTHSRYGGVVPELASREHLRAIVPVVRAALAQASIALADLDAIAVTNGPGLAGALLVGITYAKALAFAQKLPLIAVNHLEGHIHAVLLNEREQQQALQEPANDLKGTGFSPYIKQPNDQRALAPEGNPPPNAQPALALVVSGGHTHLFLARPTQDTWRYTLIGRTLDDAAGEAFDKVAKLLGLGYPGGPWIDALALHGNPHAVPFAFSQIKPKLHLAGKPPRTKAASTAPIANLDPHFLFSFSGIKTAVLRYVDLHNLRPEAESRREALFTGPDASARPKRSVILSDPERSERGVEGPASSVRRPTVEDALATCDPQTLDLIASFQHAVVGDLMKKTFAAAESLGVSRILVTGGVAANRELRQRFTAEAARRNSSHPERPNTSAILSEGRRSDRVEEPAVALKPPQGSPRFVVSFPTPALSTDNAAMIAAAAWPKFLAGDFAPTSLSADPSLALGR
jgi:N6-L-threonylcarbamoyladenine synthase